MWLIQTADDLGHQIVVKTTLALLDIGLHLLKLYCALGWVLFSQESFEHLLDVALDSELSVSELLVHLMSEHLPKKLHVMILLLIHLYRVDDGPGLLHHQTSQAVLLV